MALPVTGASALDRSVLEGLVSTSEAVHLVLIFGKNQLNHVDFACCVPFLEPVMCNTFGDIDVTPLPLS